MLAATRHDFRSAVLEPEALRIEVHRNATPSRSAKASTFSQRQDGIPPFAVFQLDTVVGERLSARATLTVPPSASMMSAAVFMRLHLR